METRATSGSRTRDLAVCACFVVFLLLPSAVSALRAEPAPVVLPGVGPQAVFPPPPSNPYEWSQWPRGVERWHFERLGLRPELARAMNFLKVWGFATSPSPRILMGPTRWIYASGYDIDAWRGADPFTPSELQEWQACVESRSRELEQRGIRYCLVLAPGKAAVYPEFLPRRYQSGGPSRTDELAAHLERRSEFRFLDPRPALLAAKRFDRDGDYLYFPFGFHWNDRGLLACTGSIVAELARTFPAVATVDDACVTELAAAEPGDTWADALYLPDLLRQSVRRVVFRDAATRALRFTEEPKLGRVTVDQDDASLPTAVVFHDSFGLRIPPLLGRHFRHAVFAFQREFDVALLEHERPDIVVQIISDRALARRHYPHDVFVWKP